MPPIGYPYLPNFNGLGYNNMPIMPMVDPQLTAQIKQLKASYKDALGLKKRKNRKRDSKVGPVALTSPETTATSSHNFRQSMENTPPCSKVPMEDLSILKLTTEDAPTALKLHLQNVPTIQEIPSETIRRAAAEDTSTVLKALLEATTGSHKALLGHDRKTLSEDTHQAPIDCLPPKRKTASEDASTTTQALHEDVASCIIPERRVSPLQGDNLLALIAGRSRCALTEITPKQPFLEESIGQNIAKFASARIIAAPSKIPQLKKVRSSIFVDSIDNARTTIFAEITEVASEASATSQLEVNSTTSGHENAIGEPLKTPQVRKSRSIMFAESETATDEPTKTSRPRMLKNLPDSATEESAKNARLRKAKSTMFSDDVICKSVESPQLRRAKSFADRTTQEPASASPLKRSATVRSTKPLTRPFFELPGDAISRKKKEALEARQRALEEEQRQRRAFKATPAKTTNPPTLPRHTAASLARLTKRPSIIEAEAQKKMDTDRGRRKSGHSQGIIY